MNQVIVIGTVHVERGRANVDELTAILEHFQPEVLFLEVPVGGLDAYFARIAPSLEARAVTRYCLTRTAALVAVDIDTPPASFFSDDEALHRQIEPISPAYCAAIDEHARLTRLLGFEYLNSYDCMRLGAEVDDAIVTALRTIGDSRLNDLHRLWLDTNRRREEEMTTRIAKYSSETSFSVGVLLVGAAHLPGLLRVARDREFAGLFDPQFEFSQAMEARSA